MPDISRAASDVLSIIFKYCLSEYASEDPEYNISKAGVPMNVTATCRHWRNTALSTPSLWKRVCVHYESKTGLNERFKRVVRHMLETWIPRSRSLPLSIIVLCSPSSRTDSCESLRVVLPPLLRCKDRWESIFIRAPGKRLWEFLLSTPAPRLKKIDIKMPKSFAGDVTRKVDTETLFPAVEHISFSGYAMFRGGPCPRLKTLIATVSVADVSDMIPQLTQLEVLRVNCAEAIAGRHPSLTTLPNLKELDLTLMFDPEERHLHHQEIPFCTYLVMPCLTDLRVCIIGGSYGLSYVFRDVSVLIATSKPPLVSFKIIYNGSHTNELEYSMLLGLIRRLPPLRTLQLPKVMVIKAVIDELVCTRYKQALVPALGSLFLGTTMSEIAGEKNGLLISLHTLLRSREGVGKNGDMLIYYLDEEHPSNWKVLSSDEDFRSLDW